MIVQCTHLMAGLRYNNNEKNFLSFLYFYVVKN